MRVYVVDEDPVLRLWLGQACAGLGIRCRVFERPENLLGVVDALAPGCVLIDIRPPDRAGLRLLEALGRRRGDMAAIAMSAVGDVDTAVRAMKLGAVDFLEKPLLEESLVEALESARAALPATKGG